MNAEFEKDAARRWDSQQVDQPHKNSIRPYVIYGVASYVLWGLIPLYFKTVAHIAPLEVLAHRVLWSFLLLAALAWLLGRGSETWRSLCDRRLVLMLGINALLLAANWLTFIYSVLSDQVLQSSLGYFMGPLVSVMLGIIVFRERLWPLQALSIVVAVAGVALLTAFVGQIPWIALVLALTGALYGLMRKIMPIDGLVSIALETGMLAPVALVYLVYLAAMSEATAKSASDLGLLMLGGPVTTVPFLLFAAAARRLRLSTMGILQYLTPSLQMLLAVGLFGESFSTTQLVSFACIWTAVAMYTVDSYRAARQAQTISSIEPLMIDP